MITPAKQKKNLETNIIFRASEETKAKAQAVKALMNVGSTSAVFRKLLDEKAQSLGIS